MNAASCFDTRARRDPGAPALRWHDGSLTYGELAERARRAATVFAACGISAGDRIALLLPNDPNFAIALLGALWLGAVPAVLSPAWHPADAASALADADAGVLVTTREAATALPFLPAHSFTVGGAGELGSFELAIDGTSADGCTSPLPRQTTDEACILYSSGTTGKPKGVLLSHGNLVFNADAKRRYCGIAPRDALALVVPIAHCFGQNVVLLGSLSAGAMVRMFVRFDAHELLAAISAGEVTHLLAVPTVFDRLLGAEDAEPLRLLRCALSAAAPLSPTLARRWRLRTGVPLRQGYGLTESSPFATYHAGDHDEESCVGEPIDGVDVRIGEIGGDGWVADGAAGEIVIRGPNVMLGYWRRPADTARALRGGWLRTGDFGRRSPAGEIHLLDRLDDAINVSGFKVYPSDVERALRSHDAVAEVAAYRLPDARCGWQVAVDVVAAPGAALDLAEVHAVARHRLAAFQRPAVVRLVASLPRSPSGKVLRRLLTANG